MTRDRPCEGRVFIATSLDGYIARTDGGIDWLDMADLEGEDFGYARFISGVDGLMMGSNTFRTALGFGDWPYTQPVVVLSRSLSNGDVPASLSGKVEIRNAAPREAMADLAKGGWRAAQVDGGALIQSCLRDGLISEMTITRLPILLGDGIPLFGATGRDITLELAGTQSWPNGLTQTRYFVNNH